MTSVFITLSFVFLTAVIFAIPPTLKSCTLRRFFAAIALSGVGIILPMMTFLLSAVLVPEWQGEYQAGWLGSFHLGKLILLPFVIWGISAFYYVQILQGKNTKPAWITGGLFAGLMTSSLCFIVGLFLIERHMDLIWFMIIPLYTSLWYALLCWKNEYATRSWPTSYTSA